MPRPSSYTPRKFVCQKRPASSNPIADLNCSAGTSTGSEGCARATAVCLPGFGVCQRKFILPPYPSRSDTALPQVDTYDGDTPQEKRRGMEALKVAEKMADCYCLGIRENASVIFTNFVSKMSSKDARLPDTDDAHRTCCTSPFCLMRICGAGKISNVRAELRQ